MYFSVYYIKKLKNNKTSVAMRFTTSSQIGQTYFLYALFDWLAKMIFSHVKYRIFYVCLNTIFLSGQNSI
jgi:hypothetical protein